MSNQDQDRDQADALRDKREQRAMWIFSVAIVLLILGGMGARMLFSHDQPSGSTEISSQSRTSADK
jgi:hypothetical protein